LGHNAVGDEVLVFENLEEVAREMNPPFIAKMYQEIAGQPIESIIDRFLDG
jgi:hypothetical protein